MMDLVAAGVVGAVGAVVVLYLLGSRGSESSPSVRLYCPEVEEDVLIATEATEPLHMEDDKAAYGCGECGQVHVFLWGPPAPIHLETTEVEP